MRLPNWLRRRKKKNSFEGSLIVDNPDIKVVEVNYDKKPLLLAVGTSKQRETTVSGKGSTEGLGAQYQTQKDLEWTVFYSPKALPDFIPIDKAKDLMAGTIAVSSGSSAVFNEETKYIEEDEENMTRDQYIDRYTMDEDSPSDIQRVSEGWEEFQKRRAEKKKKSKT